VSVVANSDAEPKITVTVIRYHTLRDTSFGRVLGEKVFVIDVRLAISWQDTQVAHRIRVVALRTPFRISLTFSGDWITVKARSAIKHTDADTILGK
jgi:hypothetical protein